MNEAGRVMTREELPPPSTSPRRSAARSPPPDRRVDEDDAKATKKRMGEKGTRQHQCLQRKLEETKGHDPFDVGEERRKTATSTKRKTRRKASRMGIKTQSLSPSRARKSRRVLLKNDAMKDQYEQARWVVRLRGAEGDRRAHLRSCGAFKASWRSAVEHRRSGAREFEKEIAEEEEREEEQEQESDTKEAIRVMISTAEKDGGRRDPREV